MPRPAESNLMRLRPETTAAFLGVITADVSRTVVSGYKVLQEAELIICNTGEIRSAD